ncbi:Uma2 family endonuclease [Polyangium sp. 6x1]|uniref:Uma2 family endonuclease n=1 Tax=Polyangium sp. 6x1 TaxID=3042689 RepID=UPI0024829107|nr:Uma2 family endonuclease [Polyangium sp. 6x1]MDI1447353.1 Uma2 family endonuclease [Polyangium sp. 6x1]
MSVDPAAPRSPPPNAPEVEAAYEAASELEVAEILDGELHLFPRPRATHARAASRLGRVLGPYDDDTGPSGWILLDEPELHLGPRPDKMVPDLAGWRRERMPEMPDVAAFTLPPDWVCEILSDRTEAIDRSKKMRIYRREGVKHCWLINPVQQTLELYRLTNGQWLHVETYEGDMRLRVEPFESVEIDMSALWAR